MTEALTRQRPRVDHPEELDRVVRRLADKFEPVAIYLFGSRAQGDASAESDDDLMLVHADDNDRVRSRQDVWQAARSGRIFVNPFLTRIGSFAWRRHEVGTLEHEVEVDGIQLYPRSPWRSPSVQRPGSINTTVVEAWLRRIEKDLILARKGCEGDDAVPAGAAFHVQQAAEKLTNAALVAHGRRPRNGHKIQEFTSRLPNAFPLKARFRELERCSDFVWVWRCPEEPGQPPEPELAEIRSSIEEIEALENAFERRLAARASDAGGQA